MTVAAKEWSSENLAQVWLASGRHDLAAPLLASGLALAREHANHQSACVLECRRARLALDRHELAVASEALSRAGDALAEAPGRTQELLLRTTRARHAALLAAEASTAPELKTQAERALDECEQADAIARAARLRGWQVEVATLRAEALLALGRTEESRDAIDFAVSTLAELAGRQARAPAVWLTRHRVLQALRKEGSGPSEEADRSLERAYTLLREILEDFDDAALRRSALENVPTHREIDRLHEELQTRRRRESTERERSYVEIAKTLHAISDFDSLLDRLLALAIETTRGEKGLILLRDPEGELTRRAARGMAQESVADASEICQSVIDDVTRGGKPVLATDAKTDDRFRERHSVISFQIRTLLCVPLVVREEVIGAVYVDGRGARSFSTEDLDFLVSFAHLAAIAIDNVRLLERLREENRALRREVETRTGLGNLICESPRMRQVAHLAEKVARSSASVLVTGETGTGKTVLARAIHGASERSEAPFVTVDCGALPREPSRERTLRSQARRILGSAS